ncbi:MAG TPA: DUF3224 domain-containing protein [Polyangiaceae bacterium]|jgi:hypothetical protein|nr:DUF3224 domain-containing protein [Polyangiaceae bacterium]
MIAKGSFEVTVHEEPPFDTLDGVSLGRAAVDKRFNGPLDGTSKVHMLSTRTSRPDSAGYVAIERITASLDGRRGSFVVLHNGVMNRGQMSLTLTIVPDSGTGDLKEIAGTMSIQIVERQHYYELDYTLGSA